MATIFLLSVNGLRCRKKPVALVCVFVSSIEAVAWPFTGNDQLIRTIPFSHLQDECQQVVDLRRSGTYAINAGLARLHSGGTKRQLRRFHQRCSVRRGTRVRKRRSEEHTSELQSRPHLVCRLLLEKKK